MRQLRMRALRIRTTLTYTLFADVSEFQVPVNDSFPINRLPVRVSDGTCRDHNFARSYSWIRAALDDGRLTIGVVYPYGRPAISQSDAETVQTMFAANRDCKPQVTLMSGVASGSNPGGMLSDQINRLYWNSADRCGSRERIIGYRNVGDPYRL